MPNSVAQQPSLANTGLIHDEILLDITKVLEHGWPVGPSFMHSLGTLAEAVVIHDRVFFDPLRRTLKQESSGDKLESLLLQSSLVQDLCREGALNPFLEEHEIDAHLASKGTDYRLIKFLEQGTWTGSSFMWAQPESEFNTYRNLLDLVKEAASVFAAERLVHFEGDPAFLTPDPPALSATKLGFNTRDLFVIEGWNRRAAAYVELCRHLGIDLYPLYSALPSQLGAVELQHSEVRRIYNEVGAQIVGEERMAVGESRYSRIPIPPLAQIAMIKCHGSPAALGQELLALRERHHKFRQYLTDLQNEWNNAETRADRNRLRHEFNGAWKTLVAREDKPVPGMVNRIIGFMWDVVSGFSSKGIAKAGGDKLIASWRERSIVRRVSGLHDFYQELAHSPVPERNRRIIVGLFPRIADTQVWDAAAELAKATEATFIR